LKEGKNKIFDTLESRGDAVRRRGRKGFLKKKGQQPGEGTYGEIGTYLVKHNLKEGV